MSKRKDPRASRSVPETGGLGMGLILLLSWLIPGYGFFHFGFKYRALFFFLILQITFLAGAALQGSVLLPEFSMQSEGFNLVTILTFLVQMCNGLLGWISLAPDLWGARAAILPYNETHPLAELGSFYLLVSGGMNYFVLVSTYDHFFGKKRETVRFGADTRTGSEGTRRPAGSAAVPAPGSSEEAL